VLGRAPPPTCAPLPNHCPLPALADCRDTACNAACFAQHPRRDHQLSKTELASLEKIDEGFATRMVRWLPPHAPPPPSPSLTTAAADTAPPHTHTPPQDIEKPGNEAGKVFPVGPARFWNERYVKDPEPNEWYQRWYQIKDSLTEDGHLKPAHHVLHAGCGNSRVCEDMYRDGFARQLNVDFSHVVIKQMLEKYSGPRALEGVDWQEMDCCDMIAFSDSKFNVVMDKGTLDTIACGDGYAARTDKYLREVLRVLKPGGVFVCVSHGEPARRMPWLTGQKVQDEYGWEITKKHVKKESVQQMLVRKGDEEEVTLQAKLAVEKAAAAEEEARLARIEAEEFGGGAAAADAPASSTESKEAADLAAAPEAAGVVAKDGEAGKKAKKAKKKKKKRKVHQEVSKSGKVIETITDPRSVHYIYLCVKFKRKKGEGGSDDDD
jgi:ubiquinone/menaquinone biosynthesis C-methylase UbiE